MATTGQTLWRKTGNTDLASFTRAITRSITTGEASPMAPSAQDIYLAIAPYGITRLAAAQSWMERKNDSWKPDYGLDASFRNPWALKGPDGKWMRFDTYRDAAKAYAERVTKPWGPYAATKTIEEYLGTYAPGSDGNSVPDYVATVCREIDALPPIKGGQVATNPFPTPVIYDIAKDADAARFSLTPAERDRLVRKCVPGRNGKKPGVIVLHIQDGVTAGSLDWWANNASASSTVLINKDGSVVRCISEGSGPWTNGLVSEPTAVGQRVINQFGPYPNEYSLTIEAEGYSAGPMPEAQLQSICWQVWEWMDRYGISLENVIRHADIDNVTRSYCPGPYYPKVIAMIHQQQGGTGNDWRNKPAWLPADLITTLFPEAVPGGLRSEAYLKYCGETGRAPQRVGFYYKDTPQEIIAFADGLMIFKDGKTSAGAA